MTRLGVIWNFLATRLIRKVAQVFGDFIDIYENDCFLSHTGVPLLFGQLLKTLSYFLFHHLVTLTGGGDYFRSFFPKRFENNV